MLPYKGNRAYHDFNWRGIVDFGSGALGDMALPHHRRHLPNHESRLRRDG